MRVAWQAVTRALAHTGNRASRTGHRLQRSVRGLSLDAFAFRLQGRSERRIAGRAMLGKDNRLK